MIAEPDMSRRAVETVSPDAYRQVLGAFPTGVTVLTASGPDGPVGMACNSFTSVSLAPPLVLVCPAKTSETWSDIRSAGRFVVNVVAAGDHEMVRSFARKGHDRFAGIGIHQRTCGTALDNAVAWIECVIADEHDAGDHTIAVARVVGIEALSEPGPLVFLRSRYGTFVES